MTTPTANENLTSIEHHIRQLYNQSTLAQENNYALLQAIDNKLGELVARSLTIEGNTATMVAYLGDIRSGVDGLHPKVDTNNGLTQQTVDTLDILNNNQSLNAQAILNFLDVMNVNGAANARLIAKAVCGDCSDVNPPAGTFYCLTSPAGITGATGISEKYYAVSFPSNSPDFVTGDTIKAKLSDWTGSLPPPDSITLYGADPREFGTTPSVSLTMGVESATLVIDSGTPYLRLAWNTPVSGNANWNFQRCVLDTTGGGS